MKLKLLLSALTIGLFTVAFNASCQKNKDCKLTVKTVDAAGLPVINAKIKIYANVKTASGATVEADLKAEGVSDNSGSSTYTFKLPAILDIRATGSGSLTGLGIIKLEEGKSVDKTITIK